MGTERVKGMPYHPESQGQVERENQTTKAALAKLIADDYKGLQDLDATTWVCLLPLVISNRNATPRRKLMNQTPYFVLHGKAAPLSDQGGVGRATVASVDPRTISDLHQRIAEKQRSEKEKVCASKFTSPLGGPNHHAGMVTPVIPELWAENGGTHTGMVTPVTPELWAENGGNHTGMVIPEIPELWAENGGNHTGMVTPVIPEL